VLLAVAFAVLTTAVAGSAVANVRDAAGHGPVRLLLLGLVATVLLPFLLVALIPVLPLVPLVLAAWLVMLAVGAVGLSEAVGRVALGGHGGRLTAAAIGGFVLALPLAAAMAVVPVLNDLGASGGVVLGAFLCLTGLLALLSFVAAGAGLITLFGLRSWPSRPFDASAQPADLLPGSEVVAGGPAVEGVPPAEVVPVTARVDAVPGPWPEPEREPEWAPEPELEPPPDVESRVAPEPETEPEPDMAAEPDMTPEREVESAPPPALEPLRERATEGGDVRDLPGLSPIYAHLLSMGGIRTLGALAAASVDDVVAAVTVPDVRPVSVETAAEWVAAARAVVEG
jgi:predicted flap endonuclease-1-like 5' DNA nuclease